MLSQLTIITATRNSEATIQNCLKSVQRVLKDYNFQHIIVDGNSTDQTMKHLRKYARSNDNVIINEQEPSGIYSALNLGIDLSTSEYVMFLHSDDVLLDTFRSVIEKGFTADVYFFGVEIIYSKNIYRQYYPFKFNSKYLDAIYPPPHTGMIVKLACLKNYKFDPKYKIASDYKQLLQLAGNLTLEKVYKKLKIVSMSAGGASTDFKNGSNIFFEEKSILQEQRFSLKTFILIAKKLSKLFMFRYGEAK